MDGILLINKPKGWTSHDVVAKIRGQLKGETGQKVKVGHAGTLDPMATGLLIILLGSYCKKAAEFSKLDKIYEAEIMLGADSTTDDAEGIITKKSARKPTRQEIKAALDKFIGQIRQIPPAFSAIKVDGQRAYKLARQGKEVKMEPRKVQIYQITDLKYDYPKLSFITEVSSGTYIRSLARDIGETVRTGAYLSALHRTQVGQFDVKDALKIDSLTLPAVQNALQK